MKKLYLAAAWLIVLTTILLMLVAWPLSHLLAQDATPQPKASATPQIAPRSNMLTVPMEGTRNNKGEGFVRLVQASPNAGSVDIYLNNQAAASDIAFSTASDFLPQPAGTYTVEVRKADDAGAAPLFTSKIVIAPGVSTTLVVLGSVGGDKALKVVPFLTERSPTMGKVRLEVIHAVPDAPHLDALSDGKPVLTGIRFGHIADAPLNLSPGTYNLSMVDSETGTSLLDMANTKLSADTIYTVILVGTVSDKSVSPLILTTVSMK